MPDFEELLNGKPDDEHLINIRKLLEEKHRTDPSFNHNQSFQQLFVRLTKNKDLSVLTEQERLFLYNLFMKGSSALGTEEQVSGNLLKNNFIKLKSYEARLFANISALKKLWILKIFRKYQAIPFKRTLVYLLKLEKDQKIKRFVLSEYADYLPNDLFLEILQDKKEPELRRLCLQVAKNKKDLPLNYFDEILQNKNEDLHDRLTVMDLYNTRLNKTLFAKIILDKTEEMKLRLAVLKKAAVRFDLDFSFMSSVLEDEKEDLRFKLVLVKYLKSKIPIEDFKKYLLNEKISLKEKYLVLKLCRERFSELNKDGTLNIIFLLMQDNEKARKMLLGSGQISSKFLGEILITEKIRASLKNEVLDYCKLKLTPKSYDQLMEEILANHKINLQFRRQVLKDFMKIVSLKPIFLILENPDDDLDFRIEILEKFKAKLLKSPLISTLEKILLNEKEQLNFQQKVLRNFFSLFHQNIISQFLLEQNAQDPKTKVFLLELKKENILQPKHLFFQNLELDKLNLETANFFLDNFNAYFEVEKVYQLIQILCSKKDFTELFRSIKEVKIRKELSEYIIGKIDAEVTQKQFILKYYLPEIPGYLVRKLIIDPDVPFALKKEILLFKPKQNYLNEGGELDFIFADREESEELRLLVFQEYRHLLNPQTIFAVKNNQQESVTFLEKLGE